MDFQMLKRRQLQALCKLNNIPANLTNAAMSDALSILPSVEGLEEFLKDPTPTGRESPERSVITSPDAPKTSARQKVTKEETEGSKLASRTRYGTRRRAVEGTDTRKTPATRTTRNKAFQEPTVQKRTEKDMQADFEADMEHSEVSDNSGLLGEMKELSEDVSGVSVDYKNPPPLEIQSGSKNPEVCDNVPEVFDVCDSKENLENGDAVSEDQDEPTEVSHNSQKVDFHSLCRRDLQSLCKKNKIPANTTSATMADALEPLDIVEGLEEFLKERNSQAPHSPTPSEMTSSCARRTWTSRRITKEPTSSKLITKSCRGSRRKVIEDIDQEITAVSETSEASTVVCSMESSHKREVQTYSRSRPTKIVADQSADLEYTAEMTSVEGRLSMVEGEKDLQCQLEAAEMEKLDVAFSVSDTINDLAQEDAEHNKFGDDYVVSDNEKGNYGFLNTDNVKELGDSESKKDVDIVDHISIGSTEVPEQLQNMMNKIDGHVQPVSDDTEVFIDAMGFVSNSGDLQLENGNESAGAEGSEVNELASDVGPDNEPENGNESAGPDNGAEYIEFQNVDLCLIEKLEGAQEDDQVVEKLEGAQEDDQVEKLEGAQEDDQVEKLEGAQEDVQVVEKLEGVQEDDQVVEKLEGVQEEDQVVEKLERTQEDDQVVEKLEGAQEDDQVEKQEDVQVLEKFNLELATVADQPPVLGNNAKTDLEIFPLAELVRTSSDFVAQLSPVEQIENNHREEENTSIYDVALISHPIEKIEAGYTESETSRDSESNIQTAVGKETPLINKSLRILKRLLKEKLQATSLANKMENLTLGENDEPLAIVEEVMDAEYEDPEGEYDGLTSVVNNAPISSVIPKDAELVHSENLEGVTEPIDVYTPNLYPVNTLLDNLISEDSVTGCINVECDQVVFGEQHLSITPSKLMKPVVSSPRKTPMSVGRMNNASEVNKENIDHSSNKTEFAYISVSKSGQAGSAMSLGKLKKAIQQHSEKKRPALQARSENCLPLASPLSKAH